jgi:spore coat protein A, manganese oxidase
LIVGWLVSAFSTIHSRIVGEEVRGDKVGGKRFAGPCYRGHKGGAMISRREFLKYAGIAGAAATLPLKFGVRSAHAFSNSMPLTKFAQPMRTFAIDIPPSAAIADPLDPGVDYHNVVAGWFRDVLHPEITTFQTANGVPVTAQGTRLFGYSGAGTVAGGLIGGKHLGHAIVATKGKPVRIRFDNQLPTTQIVPFDSTITQGIGVPPTQDRAAIHMHGGLVPWTSDGGPFHWLKSGSSTNGAGVYGPSIVNWLPDSAGTFTNDYYYPNLQSARFMWYHDHAIGITRTNAYSGVATGYLIRDTSDAAFNFMESNYGGFPLADVELLLVFQDKIFWTGNGVGALDPLYGTYVQGAQAGDLWYPYLYERARWKVNGPGKNLPIPSVVAEFFGDTMLVNGTVNPVKVVDPGAYWMRTLNACNARFLNLSFVKEDPLIPGEPLGGYVVPTPAPVDVWVVGTEGGFLPAPKPLFSQGLPVGGFLPTPFLPGPWLNGPAERFELIVNFSACAGMKVLLYNDAQGPFPAGSPLNDYYPGAPKNPVITAPGKSPNTRTLMRFDVSGTGTPRGVSMPTNAVLGSSNPVLPVVPDLVNGGLTLPVGFTSWTNPNTQEVYTYNATPQTLTLNENFDLQGRLQQLVGTGVPLVKGTFGRAYLDAPTENISVNQIQIWNVFNLTADTHPMHVHEFNAMILSRRPFQVNSFNGVTPNWTALGRGPDPGEEGWKETFKMNPGECITLAILVEDPLPATYAGAPKYVRGNYKIPGTATIVQRPTVKVGAFTGTLPISPRLQALGFIGDEYVWHCHILEHEEHDMMRPLVFHYPGA